MDGCLLDLLVNGSLARVGIPLASEGGIRCDWNGQIGFLHLLERLEHHSCHRHIVCVYRWGRNHHSSAASMPWEAQRRNRRRGRGGDAMGEQWHSGLSRERRERLGGHKVFFSIGMGKVFRLLWLLLLMMMIREEEKWGLNKREMACGHRWIIIHVEGVDKTRCRGVWRPRASPMG